LISKDENLVALIRFMVGIVTLNKISDVVDMPKRNKNISFMTGDLDNQLSNFQGS
jgi:hypothetical protein